MPLPQALRRLTPDRVRDDPRLRAVALGAGLIPPRTMHSDGEAATLARLASSARRSSSSASTRAPRRSSWSGRWRPGQSSCSSTPTRPTRAGRRCRRAPGPTRPRPAWRSPAPGATGGPAVRWILAAQPGRRPIVERRAGRPRVHRRRPQLRGLPRGLGDVARSRRARRLRGVPRRPRRQAGRPRRAGPDPGRRRDLPRRSTTRAGRSLTRSTRSSSCARRRVG